MKPSSLECNPEAIQMYLAGQLSDSDSRELEAHLDNCEPCCKQTERLAGNQSDWEEVRGFLGDDPSNESVDSISDSISFLNPSENPRMLGRFGGYEIAGVIGQGGMGVVLKGFDESLNRYAAIKVLAPQLATHGSARSRFDREAKAAAAVIHENVIAIHGVSEAAGLPYLVMPYVRGESLQKTIKDNGPLETTEVVRIAYQLAAGLAAAHAQGLVHRDIKPGNILLPKGVQRVLITDFGLARAVDDSNLTGTGSIAGTPQYMSPEQARGEVVNGSSDLFSLGCVMYTMCTGRAPFRGENAYAILRCIIESVPVPVRELNPTIPDWLEAVIQKLMSKDPVDRFQDAAHLSEVLQKCLAHLQISSVRLPVEVEQLLDEKTTSPQPNWIRRAIVASGLLLLASLAGIAAWGMAPKQEDANDNPSTKRESMSRLLDQEKKNEDEDAARERQIAEALKPFRTLSENTPKPEPANAIRGRWKFNAVKLDGRQANPTDIKTDSNPLWPIFSELNLEKDKIQFRQHAPTRAEFLSNVTLQKTVGDSVELAISSEQSKHTKTLNCQYQQQLGLAVVLELSAKNESGQQITCVYSRDQQDPLFLDFQARESRVRAIAVFEVKDSGYLVDCEMLLEFARLSETEAELRRKLATMKEPPSVSRNRDGANAELPPAARFEYDLLVRKIMKTSADRLQLTRNHLERKNSREKMETIIVRIASLQKEGNYEAARQLEISLLGLLRSEDQDYDRIVALRKKMVRFALEGHNQKADEIQQEIRQIEERLKKRYHAEDQQIELGNLHSKAARIYHDLVLAKKSGQDESVAKLEAELKSLRNDVMERFGKNGLLEIDQVIDSMKETKSDEKKKTEQDSIK